MSRNNVAPGRSLTLTEELEKLEQSITLTLQEIDHNFSKAHRIVTTSILPVVEQYAQHSQDVWDGSKFWKQFFEASANVSLSGYEETAVEEDRTYMGDSVQDSSVQTPPTTTVRAEDLEVDDEQVVDDESSMLDSPSNATGIHATPKMPGSSNRQGESPPASRLHTADLPSRLRAASTDEPSTPRRYTSHRDQVLSSSPFQPPSVLQPSSAQRKSHDPLLHRVLDKTYRIQATPHTARRTRTQRGGISDNTPLTSANTTRRTLYDSSPQSSPAMPAPQLRADLFSPAPRSNKKSAHMPRTPGVPLRSPASRMTSTGRPVTRQPTDPQDLTRPLHQQQQHYRTPALWDSDEEGDDTSELDISPPKTMQFVVPGSRLVQTPAREASRRIVEDLLTEAGAEDTDEIEGLDAHVEAPSPTLVRAIHDESTF